MPTHPEVETLFIDEKDEPLARVSGWTIRFEAGDEVRLDSPEGTFKVMNTFVSVRGGGGSVQVVVQLRISKPDPIFGHASQQQFAAY